MLLSKRVAVRVVSLASTFVLALVIAPSPPSPQAAIIRDHRKKLCRAVFSPYPSMPGVPLTTSLCGVKGTPALGAFCTCLVLVEGKPFTAPGNVVLASSPNE